jgi:hypothetical protein
VLYSMHVVSSCLESWRSNQYMRTWHKINKKQGVDSASCMVGSLLYVHFPSHYFSFAPFFSPFFPFGPFSSFPPFSSFYTCFLPFWSFYMWFLLFVFFRADSFKLCPIQICYGVSYVISSGVLSTSKAKHIGKLRKLYPSRLLPP